MGHERIPGNRSLAGAISCANLDHHALTGAAEDYRPSLIPCTASASLIPIRLTAPNTLVPLRGQESGVGDHQASPFEFEGPQTKSLRQPSDSLGSASTMERRNGLMERAILSLLRPQAHSPRRCQLRSLCELLIWRSASSWPKESCLLAGVLLPESAPSCLSRHAETRPGNDRSRSDVAPLRDATRSRPDTSGHPSTGTIEGGGTDPRPHASTGPSAKRPQHQAGARP